jgi:hypothetical protein
MMAAKQVEQLVIDFSSARHGKARAVAIATIDDFCCVPSIAPNLLLPEVI